MFFLLKLYYLVVFKKLFTDRQLKTGIADLVAYLLPQNSYILLLSSIFNFNLEILFFYQ